MPLSRELDPLFRSEVCKPPIRIGRTENLTAVGAVVWTRGRPRLGGHGQRSGPVRMKIGRRCRFKAGAHARFVERTRAPGEPQSAGGEERRDWEGQMFWFHCFVLIPHSLSPRHCARICGSWLSIWNESGEFWCEAPVSRNKPDLQIGKRAAPGLQLHAQDISSSGTRVFAGSPEADG